MRGKDSTGLSTEEIIHESNTDKADTIHLTDGNGTQALTERYGLATKRIAQIGGEESTPVPYRRYFQKTAAFLVMVTGLYDRLRAGEDETWSLARWEEINQKLYEDILPAHYAQSYANPSYAAGQLGESMGKLFSFLSAELRGLIGYVFEDRLEETVCHLELFLEIYNAFEQPKLPTFSQLRQILYWFESDYCDVFVTHRVRQVIDPSLDMATRIICSGDLEDPRYLYRYGEYITRNERQMAVYLNSLPEDEIRRMASVYTEGYRMGFVNGGKDLSKKQTVNVRFPVGFERVVRVALQQFADMGLKPTIHRYALCTVNKRASQRIGYAGADPNPQFGYDHREDAALYLDGKFVRRRLDVMRAAYESYRELAAAHAGPAVIETFGEKPFLPAAGEHAWKLSAKQQELLASMNNEAAQITNRYIIGRERSFTIIAFPTPQIGPHFEEIFRETIRINTLDYQLYQGIQQALIDALDQGVRVRVKGSGANRTDLEVALHPLQDPAKETIFENCLADVNIPLGEVFTTPALEGTNGTLHVSQVFLAGLNYLDLELTFRDGMITDYRCANFDREEESRDYIRANVLYHHETLPMGEFAIGTNTTAYAMIRRYGIGALMPILIAEKTGPHFAVGDTCYSFAEDNPVFNPDGKEIIAKDNAVSLLRTEDASKAYFGCHTDITLPYDELGLLEVVRRDGSSIPLIRDGRFVLPGTEPLNKALEEARGH